MILMELQKTKHQIKLEQWRRLIYECRNSSLTVKTWCAENQINMQTYYRWQKKVWEAGMQNTEIIPTISGGATFAEYRPPTHASGSGTAVTLHIGQIRVEIQNGANEQTIETVIHTISRLC